jgi:hypothetical protein
VRRDVLAHDHDECMKIEAFYNELMSIGADEQVDWGTATLTYAPTRPSWGSNYISNVDVAEEDVDRFLRLTEDYYASKAYPAITIRVTPSTRPTTLSSQLETRGYVPRHPHVVMVYQGGPVDFPPHPTITIRDISQDLDTYLVHFLDLESQIFGL